MFLDASLEHLNTPCDNKHMTPLHAAVSQDHCNTAAILINAAANDECDAACAASVGALPPLRVCMRSGAAGSTWWLTCCLSHHPVQVCSDVASCGACAPTGVCAPCAACTACYAVLEADPTNAACQQCVLCLPCQQCADCDCDSCWGEDGEDDGPPACMESCPQPQTEDADLCGHIASVLAGASASCMDGCAGSASEMEANMLFLMCGLRTSSQPHHTALTPLKRSRTPTL